jgi:hypothetical protein
VVAPPESPLRVEPLGPQHDRNSFNSGVEALDRYFRAQAGQEARKNIAAPFVLVLPDGAVGGYYTISATAVNLTEFPAEIIRRLPRYPLIPATLIGRLAVDVRCRGKGYGRWLLAALCIGYGAARLPRSRLSWMQKTKPRDVSTSGRVSCRFRISHSSCFVRWLISPTCSSENRFGA